MYPKRNKKIYWQYYRDDSFTDMPRFFRFDPSESSVYYYDNNYGRAGTWIVLDGFLKHYIMTGTTKITEEEFILELI